MAFITERWAAGLTQGSEMHSCSWPQTTKSRKRGRKLSFMKSLLLPAWAMRFWCSAKMLYQALWGKSSCEAGLTLHKLLLRHG